MKWSTDSPTLATISMVNAIQKQISNHSEVLLLISGGSAIKLEADIVSTIRVGTAKLHILPMDERFGSKGHADSNIAQLKRHVRQDNAVTFHDVLDENLPFNDTVEHYSSRAQDLFARANYIVAIFGIGPDGHTAGLLPGSPATTDTVSTVIGYSWHDYTRMTLGLSSLLQINTAFVLAYGDSKISALNRLKANDESFADLPAKVLYDIADVTIYNDFITSDEKDEG